MYNVNVKYAMKFFKKIAVLVRLFFLSTHFECVVTKEKRKVEELCNTQVFPTKPSAKRFNSKYEIMTSRIQGNGSFH